MPGSPLDPRAQGCNLLIREGATLVQTAEDVLEAIRPLAVRPFRAAASSITRAAAAAPTPTMPTRRAVADLLGPTPVAGRRAHPPVRPAAPAIVQTVLLELELAGRLERHAGGRVSLTRYA